MALPTNAPIVRPTPYWGNAHPCNMYRNGVKLAGYRWSEQTGTDMSFEGTYNDRLEVLAQGKGKQAQTMQGKNLFDKARVTNDFGLSSSGNLYADATMFTSSYIPVSPGLTYTLSGRALSGTNCWYDENKVYISYVYRITGQVTAPANARYVRNAGFYTDSFDTLQFELGSTATPYEPFVPDSPSPAYPSPIISANGDLAAEGRSLFDDAGALITYVKREGNTFTWQTTGGQIDVVLKPGTYTLSFKRNRTFPIYVRNGRVSSGYIVAVPAVATSVTFSFSNSVDGYIRISSFEVGGALSDIQIERGSVAHPYTPYRPIITHALPELRGIPDGAGGWVARDTLEVVGGRWRLTQRVGRFTASGSADEPWNYSISGTAHRVYMLFSAIPPASPSSRILCSRAKYTAPLGGYPAVGYASINDTPVLLIGVDGAIISSVADWRSQLAVWHAAGDPMIVDYPLATPIITDLGPVDLPTHYPFTRVLIDGDYPPDVTARARVVDI